MRLQEKYPICDGMAVDHQTEITHLSMHNIYQCTSRHTNFVFCVNASKNTIKKYTLKNIQSKIDH